MFTDRGQIRAKPFYPGQWGVWGSDNGLGLRTVPEGITYYVHSENPNANDQHSGTDPEYPMSTVLAAYNRTVSGQNDTVVVIGQATAYNQAATLVWANSYTHFVGVSAPLHGVGQRVRLVGTAAVDISPVLQITGSGCIFQNVQINNEHDAASDSGAVELTGDRCYFENVFFAGMVSGAAAARAGSFSLKLTGAHENLFENCTIGVDTVVRAAANAELIHEVGSSKNTYENCNFYSASETDGKFMVHFLTSVAPQGLTSFRNCLFYNNSVNWAVEIDFCFNITGPQATYYIDVDTNCRLMGIEKWSNVNTHVYVYGAVAAAGTGIRQTPTA